MNQQFALYDVVKFILKGIECVGVIEYVDNSYPGHTQYEVRITCPKELAGITEAIDQSDTMEASYMEQVLFGTK